MRKYITVKSIYNDNGNTARIRLDAVSRSLTKLQADNAVRKLCIGGDYIKLAAPCNQDGQVSIYDHNGNCVGHIS